MTRDDVLNMEAGMEMDRLIAEKAMGIDLSAECDGEMYNEDDSYWSCTKCSKTGEWGPNEFRHTIEPEHYSVSIDDAFRAAEKVELFNYFYLTKDIQWQIGNHGEYGFDEFTVLVEAETAPLVICRAILFAVMDSQ